jgi:hypothetical protein
MRQGEELRITAVEGTIVTVESDEVIRSFVLEPADDGHREHGGLGAGQMFTVREDAEVGKPVEVDVWGCGCKFTLVPPAPV